MFILRATRARQAPPLTMLIPVFYLLYFVLQILLYMRVFLVWKCYYREIGSCKSYLLHLCDNRTQKFPIDITWCLTHILMVTTAGDQYFKETNAASRIYNYHFPNNSIFIQNIHACIIGFAKQSTISKILGSIWSKEVLAMLLLMLFREWGRLIVDNLLRELQRLFERIQNKTQREK